MGTKDVQVQDVPEPKILNRRDAIVRITSTAICGSDLHLYNGFMPTMKEGDILGHEFMGEVVELGPDVSNLKVGDRVVVPFPIACGNCNACQAEAYSLCENSNPNAAIAEKVHGHGLCGIFGYSHMLGGYPGGQSEYARVPFATWDRSRSRTACRTSPCCSCPTSSRPATWAPRCATSSPVTSWPSGAPEPSACSPRPAPSCWAPSA
jgi:threonine dehydrogenase-like Zn-dependent dehydrogenase